MSRIRPDADQMKIEHWRAQSSSKYPERQLDYSNLLGACTGKDGHCDTSKGDKDLSKNPADPEHAVEVTLRFPGDGRIESSNPVFNDQIERVLNLNTAFLVANRKAILESFKSSLPRRGDWSPSALEKELRKWNGESHSGDLDPYCQVIVYYLRKRLARRR